MAHSSSCSAITAPTRRMTDARVGEIPTTSVRRRISRFSRSWGLLDQIWTPVLFGKTGERQQVGSGLVEVGGGVGEAGCLELVDDAAVLGPHRIWVGLSEDGPDHGRDHLLGGFRHFGQQ